MAYTGTLQKLAQNLQTTYENTIFSQSGDIGDTREKEVIKYLKKVMAHKYGFQSGEIFDESDANSGQVDVIIYDSLFSTIFTDGSEKIFAPVESTYGVVSVKSKMGIKELKHAIEGIKKFNELKRPIIKENTLQVTPDFGITLGNGLSITGSSVQRNVNCIFAFETSVAVETLIQEVKNSGCVDLLVVPGKLCIMGRNRKEFALKDFGGKTLEFVGIRNENSVGLFILFLQIYLSRNVLVARDVKSLALNLIHGSEVEYLRN